VYRKLPSGGNYFCSSSGGNYYCSSGNTNYYYCGSGSNCNDGSSGRSNHRCPDHGRSGSRYNCSSGDGDNH
jgi:hypothetical protein